MDDLEYKPIKHDRERFFEIGRRKKGFQEAYDALELEYEIANQMLRARTRAKMTQDAVAKRMGTTKSAVSRLESASNTSRRSRP